MNVYLASPLGFAQSTKMFMPIIEKVIVDCGYTVVNPWHLADAREFEEFEAASLIQDLEQQRLAFHKLNMQIAARNERAIHKRQMVVAVLDGVDVDSGTASEIGFAYALGKRIYGYRSDFRRAGDNEGSIINLQVEYWVENSGGCIVTKLDELRCELVKAARSLAEHCGAGEVP